MAEKDKKSEKETIPSSAEDKVEGPKVEKRKATSSRKAGVKKAADQPVVEEKMENSNSESRKEIVIDVKAKDPQPEEKKEEKKAEPKKEEAAQQKPAEEKASGEPSSQQEQSSSPSTGMDRSAIFFGGGLLVMGLIFLLGHVMHISFGTFIWPFIFIVPGVLVFLTALSSDSSSGEGLAILGGILTTLGVVFLTQSVTNLWGSWAYAWALVAPTSVGFAQIIYGEHKGREAIVESGHRLVKIGLTIFVIGFVFFELIFGVSGFGLARFGLPPFPMVLIGLGLIILIRSFMRSRK